MKKFQLFSEYCNAILYGDDLSDAVTRAREISKPKKYQHGRVVEKQAQVIIERVVGYENTNASTRGGSHFLRVIVETVEGKIIAIDAVESCEIVEKAA